jgi:hypothetical protein
VDAVLLIKIVFWHLFIPLLLTCALSCKTSYPQTKAQGPSAGQLNPPRAATAPVPTSCGLSSHKGVELPRFHNNDFELAKFTRYQEAFSRAFAAIPAALRNKFIAAGGEVIFARDLASSCSSIKSSSLSISSCWLYDEDTLTPRIYLGDFGEERIAEDTLSLLAKVYAELLSRISSSEGKNSEDESSSEWELFSLQLVAALNSQEELSTSFTYASEIFSYAFTGYYCSATSRNTLAGAMPELYAAMESFAQRFGPSLQLSRSPGKLVKLERDTRLHAQLAENAWKKTIPPSPLALPLRPAQGQKFQRGLGEIPSVKAKKDSALNELLDEASLYERIPILGKYNYIGFPRLLRAEIPVTYPARRGTRLKQKKPINILIHGSTSGGEVVQAGKWPNPNGKAADLVAQHFGGSSLSFQWSGKLDNAERSHAADVLRANIMDLIDKGYEVNLITHSHGGNVAIEAINGLPNRYSIGEFVSLARPIRSDYYLEPQRVNYYTTAIGDSDHVVAFGGGYTSFGDAYESGATRSRRGDLEITVENSSHTTIKDGLYDILKISEKARTQGIVPDEKGFCAIRVCKIKAVGRFLGVGISGAGIYVGYEKIKELQQSKDTEEQKNNTPPPSP